MLGVDRALVGVDAANAVVLDVDTRHLGAREHARTAFLRVLAHQRSRPQRIDHRDARCVEAAEDHVLVEERHALEDLLGRQQVAPLLAPGQRGRHAPVQLLHPHLRPRDLDAAADRGQAELLVLAGALLR